MRKLLLQVHLHAVINRAADGLEQIFARSRTGVESVVICCIERQGSIFKAVPQIVELQCAAAALARRSKKARVERIVRNTECHQVWDQGVTLWRISVYRPEDICV